MVLRINSLYFRAQRSAIGFCNGVGMCSLVYRGAGKSLTRPGRKQATATEDFDVHISLFYAFFWVIPRRLEFICRRFGTLCSIFI